MLLGINSAPGESMDAIDTLCDTAMENARDLVAATAPAPACAPVVASEEPTPEDLVALRTKQDILCKMLVARDKEAERVAATNHILKALRMEEM